MIHYNICPICSSNNITAQLSALDNTVTKKTFSIWHCNICTARFTQDIPEQSEIGFYYQSENYISHSDTQKGIINRLYHLVRNITLNTKRNLIEDNTTKNKGTILDIGCGTGAFLNTMKNGGWKITGLEPDEIARNKAKELYKIIPQPSQNLFTLENESFNVITLWHVLEHVHDLHLYINQIQKLLAPKGKIFIAVPNYTSFDASHYNNYWAAYDVPRHLYHFSPKSLQQLIAPYGLKLSTIKPMWFDSFYVSMLSEKIKDNKNNFIKAMYVGFVSNIKALINKEKCSSIIYIIEKK